MKAADVALLLMLAGALLVLLYVVVSAVLDRRRRSEDVRRQEVANAVNARVAEEVPRQLGYRSAPDSAPSVAPLADSALPLPTYWPTPRPPATPRGYARATTDAAAQLKRLECSMTTSLPPEIEAKVVYVREV